MAVIICINDKDPEMIDFYSDQPKGGKLLWCVAHEDILGEFGLTKEDFHNADEIELPTVIPRVDNS